MMLQDVDGPAVCAYWDQTLDERFGAWSYTGCRQISDTNGYIICECTHLTNFVILVDTAYQDTDKHISWGIIVGPLILLLCAIFVIICILITRSVILHLRIVYVHIWYTYPMCLWYTYPVCLYMVYVSRMSIYGIHIPYLLCCKYSTCLCSFFVFRSELRENATGRFLANLCVSTVLFCIIFIIAYFVGGTGDFCTAIAFFLHYFILVALLALPTMAIFMGWSPLSGIKLKILYIAAIVINWGKRMIYVIACTDHAYNIVTLSMFFSASCSNSDHMHCFGCQKL